MHRFYRTDCSLQRPLVLSKNLGKDKLAGHTQYTRPWAGSKYPETDETLHCSLMGRHCTPPSVVSAVEGLEGVMGT
jgi:hypothetical protein